MKHEPGPTLRESSVGSPTGVSGAQSISAGAWDAGSAASNEARTGPGMDCDDTMTRRWCKGYAVSMRAALVSMVLFPLAGIIGCGELMVDDSLMVCVEPVYADYGSDGEYPANTAFPITAVIPASEGEILYFKCEVEVSGEFELTVHAKWRELDKYDVGAETERGCGKTPELAPGTWTLIHGENSEEFEIPTLAEAEQQPGPREDHETSPPGQLGEPNVPVCVSPI